MWNATLAEWYDWAIYLLPSQQSTSLGYLWKFCQIYWKKLNLIWAEKIWWKLDRFVLEWKISDLAIFYEWKILKFGKSFLLLSSRFFWTFKIDTMMRTMTQQNVFLVGWPPASLHLTAFDFAALNFLIRCIARTALYHRCQRRLKVVNQF